MKKVFLECLFCLVIIVFSLALGTIPAYAMSYVTPQATYVSSQLNNTEWNMNNLIDGNTSTSWSSQQLPDSTANEWLSFDFGSPTFLAKIILTPRVWNNLIQAFPQNFNLGYSDDGTTWFILPGSEFYNYPTPQVYKDGSTETLSLPSFPVNASHRFFGMGFTKAATDSYGGYFIQLSEVKFVGSECQSDSECGGGQSCRQGVCGVNTLPYWNLQPGNYWILAGTDKYGGSSLSFRQRYDLELPENMCTDGSSKNVLTWRMTRDVACPSPHQCYWGNLRFMFANPAFDNSPYIWATADKRYDRDLSNPFLSIGSLYQHSYFSGWQDLTHPYVPSYLYTPKFLPNLGNNIEYRYTQNYSWNIGTSGTPISDGNMCQDQSLSHAQADLIMRYKMTSINTSAYSGPALLLSQGEKAGWCIREDWYLIPNIGIGRVDQWNCNNTCASWTSDPGNNANCYQNIALNDPPMTMSLEKYYLGAALQVTSEGNQSISVLPGKTITLDFLDPTTNFKYEGALEIDNNFLSSDGNSIVSSGIWGNVWIGPSGIQNITVGNNIPYGTYRVKFRSHPFSSPDSALQTNSEGVSVNNSLPWSNQFTVNIITLPGDLNHDIKVDRQDYDIFVANFGNTSCGNVADIDSNCIVDIFDYNVLVGNWGK